MQQGKPAHHVGAQTSSHTFTNVHVGAQILSHTIYTYIYIYITNVHVGAQTSSHTFTNAHVGAQILSHTIYILPMFMLVLKHRHIHLPTACLMQRGRPTHNVGAQTLSHSDAPQRHIYLTLSLITLIHRLGSP